MKLQNTSCPRYCSRCGGLLRDGQPHRDRKECQAVARESSDAGMTIISLITLITIALLVVISEIISRAPRPIIHLKAITDNWQVGLIFVAIVLLSLFLIFAADRFWKRK